MKAPFFMGTRVRNSRRFVRPLRPVCPMQQPRPARITRRLRLHSWLYALTPDAPLHLELASLDAPACTLTLAGIDTLQALAERDQQQAEQAMNDEAAEIQEGRPVDEHTFAANNRRWIAAARRINVCKALRIVEECRGLGKS